MIDRFYLLILWFILFLFSNIGQLFVYIDSTFSPMAWTGPSLSTTNINEYSSKALVEILLPGTKYSESFLCTYR